MHRSQGICQRRRSLRRSTVRARRLRLAAASRRTVENGQIRWVLTRMGKGSQSSLAQHTAEHQVRRPDSSKHGKSFFGNLVLVLHLNEQVCALAVETEHTARPCHSAFISLILASFASPAPADSLGVAAPCFDAL